MIIWDEDGQQINAQTMKVVWAFELYARHERDYRVKLPNAKATVPINLSATW